MKHAITGPVKKKGVVKYGLNCILHKKLELIVLPLTEKKHKCVYCKNIVTISAEGEITE
jgi:hypothetical protein